MNKIPNPKLQIPEEFFMRKVFFLFTIFALLLAACGTQATPAPSAPASGGAAKAIENYLTALTGKKLDAVKNA
ncbi:MAG: hypothetical protein HZB17_16120, partial [Chloroflexi bacterium]|nr:hypothetical protein [Chloroflexota bacterium]